MVFTVLTFFIWLKIELMMINDEDQWWSMINLSWNAQENLIMNRKYHILVLILSQLGVVGHVSVQAGERLLEEGQDPAVPETPVGAGGVPRHRGVEDGGQVYDLC